MIDRLNLILEVSHLVLSIFIESSIGVLAALVPNLVSESLNVSLQLLLLLLLCLSQILQIGVNVSLHATKVAVDL